MNNYFKVPEDLTSKPKEPNYFSPAEDLMPEVKESNDFKPTEEITMKEDEISEYLKSIVTGKRTPTEFGKFPLAAGRRLVTLDKLKEMVANGDNIVSAKYFPEMGMVEIEFETFNLVNTSARHR